MIREEFIIRAHNAHGDIYDYSLVPETIKTVHDKVTIICKHHGEYDQKAYSHYGGHGCSKCDYINRRVGRADFSHVEVPEGAKLIPLTRGQYALIDEEDYERVMKHSWTVQFHGKTHYAFSRINGTIRRMHRFILNITDPKQEIDHKNHCGWDNRKENLRLCTRSENIRNTRPYSGSSKYKGVHKKVMWEVIIKVGKKTINLGSFKSEDEAALAYNKKITELYGDMAYLNVVEN